MRLGNTYLIPRLRSDFVLERATDRPSNAAEVPSGWSRSRLPVTFNVTDILVALAAFGSEPSAYAEVRAHVKSLYTPTSITRLAGAVSHAAKALEQHVERGGAPWRADVGHTTLYQGRYRWFYDGGQAHPSAVRAADAEATNELVRNLKGLQSWLETVAELDGAVRVEKT